MGATQTRSANTAYFTLMRLRVLAAAGLALAVLIATAWVLPRLGHRPGPSEERDVPTARPAAGLPVGLAFGDQLRRMSDAELATALDDTVDLGASWIRVDVSWAAVQPDSGAAYDWSGTDRVVQAASARGLRVLGILTYTPPWARAPGCVTFTCPPRDAAQFAAYAGAVAGRYGDRVSAYEVWNEPNTAKFWTGPDPAAYGLLLRATVPRIQEAAPGTPVLLGGLAANPGGLGVVLAPDFLARACQEQACAGVAGVGYHPYTFPATAVDTTADLTAWQRMTQPSAWGPSLRTVMTQVGLGDRRLWLTEYGAPTDGDTAGEAPSGCTTCVTEQEQAEIVASGISAARAAPDVVGAVFVYSWRDLGTGPSREDHFGLVRTDGSRKPAFDAFARAARG